MFEQQIVTHLNTDIIFMLAKYDATQQNKNENFSALSDALRTQSCLNTQERENNASNNMQ